MNTESTLPDVRWLSMLSTTIWESNSDDSKIMVMSLPIRYSSMAFYFRLSIIFFTLQILRHRLRQRDLSQLSLTIPYTHHTISPVPCRRPFIWPMDHIVTFSFLSLFSFTQHILLQSDQSQIVAPHDRDLTIHFATHKPCAQFTYRLYLRLLYLLWKTRKFSPRTQT